MGIYVQCFADLPPLTTAAEIAVGIAKSARAWAVGRDLSDIFYATEPNETGVWLTFYPPMGGIRFDIARGRVQFDAKTSVAGPGFHAALIDLCDCLQKELALKWRWDAGGDQTGYAVYRDIDGLLRSFTDQFIAFCDYYQANSEPYRHHALNLSEGTAMEGHEGVATPLGPLPIQVFLDAKEHSDAVGNYAKRVFPWWDVVSATFWLDTLRTLLWSEVEWRAPRTTWEKFIFDVVMRIAKRTDLSNEYDLKIALQELNSLADRPDDFFPPGRTGIGYLRHLKAFFLPGPWRINLPGYYIEQSEDEGRTTCLWFGSEEIRGSSFTMELKEKGLLGWNKKFEGCEDRRNSTCAYRVLPTTEPSDSAEGHFTAWAEFHAADGEGTGHILLISLFDAKPDVVLRLETIAKDVWFNPPAILEKRRDA